jgi:hypothetical protein
VWHINLKSPGIDHLSFGNVILDQVDHADLHAAVVGSGDIDKPIRKEDLMHWFYNEHAVAQLRGMFDELDDDKSGYLDTHELPKLLHMCAGTHASLSSRMRGGGRWMHALFSILKVKAGISHSLIVLVV